MDGSSNGSHQLLPAAIEAAASAVLEADSTHALQDHNQAPAAAAVAAGASAGNVSGSSLLQQQEEQHAGMEEGAFQSQQLLLVGSKVTGDRHVPAGQVTFAVDLGSRSREGAGQLLQLPAGVRTAVEVNGPGTRPLVLKVCGSFRGVRGRAQTHYAGDGGCWKPGCCGSRSRDGAGIA